MVAYAARTASASRSPSTTPPPSDLCSRPIALSTNGNVISAASSAASSSAGLRTVWAGLKETPASANSLRAPSYDASLTGAAAGSESQVVLLDDRGLHQPREHGSRAVDVAVHRDPGRTQQHPGLAVGVDRVHDDRLGLARHEVRHHIARRRSRGLRAADTWVE